MLLQKCLTLCLLCKSYVKAIDVWSVGCILAEMLSGKPLFPGRDYHHQLTLILDVLGTPTLDEFYAITTRRSRDYIRALPFRKKKPFTQLFPNANPNAIDFLTKTLVRNFVARLRRHNCAETLNFFPFCRHSIQRSGSQ